MRIRFGSYLAGSLMAAATAVAFFWALDVPQLHGQDAPPAAPQGDAPKGGGPGGPGGPGGGKGGRGGRGGKGGAPAVPAGPVRRLPNGKPDIGGYWKGNGGGLFSIEATGSRKQIGGN